MRYLSIDWRQRSSLLILADGNSYRDWRRNRNHETTKRIREAGELLDIGLLDHIIIDRNGAYYSFMENNGISGQF